MKRTAIWTIWSASVIVAFLVGRSTVSPDRTEIPDGVSAAQASQLFDEAIPPAAGLDPPDVDLIGSARERTREGRPLEALERVTSHLREHPRDAQALFLLSDLRQMTGDVDEALEPLLEILAFPPTPEVADRARQRLQVLINAREQQLINAGDLVSLVAYFEALVLAEPGWDGHRLKLARWLARSGSLDEASRTLREVGLTGVTQAEIDALEGEIELARAALPVERQGGAMYTRAEVAGPARAARYRFLIDTGATMTGLAESRLLRLGAERIDQGVKVQTANGIAELPVYRLRELSLGPLVVRDLPVLGFAELPRDADGLLGMDVLDRLSGGLPGTVGRPGIPR